MDDRAPDGVLIAKAPPPIRLVKVKVSYYAAGMALLLGLFATGMLVARHFSRVAIPGCSAEGGCAAAEASRWGNLAGWPVSFLGLSYFVALLAAWLHAGINVSVPFLWVVRLAVLASIYWVSVLLVNGYFCPYCLTTHAANFIFYLSLERRRQPSVVKVLDWVAPLGAFSLALSLLSVIETRHRKAEGIKAEKQLDENLVALVPPKSGSLSEKPMGFSFWEPYRMGPEKAKVHLIIFGDFACEFCLKAHAEARTLVNQFPGEVTFSIKHFPLCKNCNWLVKTVHRNSCLAAQAAEAAGILQGSKGFWRMCEWLANHRGNFTEKELREALPGLGFPQVDRFIDSMNGPEALQRVRDDIGEGAVFRSDTVPVILINGVELKGWIPGNKLEPIIKAAIDRISPRFPNRGYPKP